MKLPVFGSKYKEFTDSMRMTQDTIRIHINDLQTYEEVLAWYIEMNAGGTPHKNPKSSVSKLYWMLRKGPIKTTKTPRDIPGRFSTAFFLHFSYRPIAVTCQRPIFSYKHALSRKA